MATKFVRVKDNKTGHEYTVAERAVTDGLTVIDKPAVDRAGRPLPAKPKVNLEPANSGDGEATTQAEDVAAASTTQTSSATTSSGDKAAKGGSR